MSNTNSKIDNTDDLLYVKREEGNVVDYGGYKKDYLVKNLTELEEGLLICHVCLGIMRQPSIVSGETTCLLCSKNLDYNPVKLVEDCTDKIDIKCPLLRNCSWKGKLSEAEPHLNNCVYFMIKCSDCGEAFSRGDMNAHRQSSCQMRFLHCEFCNCVKHACDMDEHLKTCSLNVIPCPNNCKNKFPRKEMPLHNTECPLTEVECPYAKYGCGAKTKRKDLLAHKKENIIEHVDMVEMENRTLKVKVNWLASEIKTMKRQDGVEWEIKTLLTLKEGTKLDGPTFYVKNYKLKCSFQVGRVLLRKSELKFFLMRIPGEHDNCLGKDSITRCQFILVDAKCYANSNYSDLQMNYDLTIGKCSEIFNTVWLDPVDTCVRMYFELSA